jgi:hypothetical protein
MAPLVACDLLLRFYDSFYDSFYNFKTKAFFDLGVLRFEAGLFIQPTTDEGRHCLVLMLQS